MPSLIFVLTLSCVCGLSTQSRSRLVARKECPPPSPPPTCPIPPVVTSEEDDVTNLLSKTGWHLAVSGQGKVHGEEKGTGWDSDAVLQIIPRGGFHQIKALKANLYIAMNDQGTVYAERDKESANTKWQQTYDGRRWRRYKWLGNDKGWYLAIQRNGKTKNGSLTGANQNGVQFEHARPGKSKASSSEQKGELICNNWQLSLPSPHSGTSAFVARCLAASRERGMYADRILPLNVTEDSDHVFVETWRRARSQVQFRGKKSGLHIAMDKNGVVYAEPDGRKINTWWKATYLGDNQDATFEWAGNAKGWCLGVDGNGVLKKGDQVQKMQPEAKFRIVQDYAPRKTNKI